MNNLHFSPNLELDAANSSRNYYPPSYHPDNALYLLDYQRHETDLQVCSIVFCVR